MLKILLALALLATGKPEYLPKPRDYAYGLDSHPTTILDMVNEFNLTLTSVCAHANLLDPTSPDHCGTAEIIKAIKLAHFLGVKQVITTESDPKPASATTTLPGCSGHRGHEAPLTSGCHGSSASPQAITPHRPTALSGRPQCPPTAPFFGDSITWSWSLGPTTGRELWGNQFADYRPIHMGNSGDITPVMLLDVNQVSEWSPKLLYKMRQF